MQHKDKKITKSQSTGTERLQKIIASTGFCSRRKAEELILDGKVSVNGKIIKELGSKADPYNDSIKVNGKQLILSKVERYRYFVLNKPAGYITSLSDPQGRPIVMDLLPRNIKRLLPVGRLDYNTEGILLFTNDGEALHRLTHPKFGVKRTYLVRTKGGIPQEKLDKVQRSGVYVQGALVKDIKIRNVRHTSNASWFEIEIGEGRNREVRKIVEAMDSEVARLKRIAYGPISSGIPPKGRFRELTRDEIKAISDLLQIKR